VADDAAQIVNSSKESVARGNEVRILIPRNISKPLWAEYPQRYIALARLWGKENRDSPTRGFAFCTTTMSAYK
jgi:hypothetical protein